jgi:hypothetical protein
MKNKYDLWIYLSIFSIFFLIFMSIGWVASSLMWLITGDMISRTDFFLLTLSINILFFLFIIVNTLLQKKS